MGPFRTTPEAVAGLIDVIDGFDLTPFIFSANELVTQCCVGDPTTGVSYGYSDDRLELIERWLSAHFYAVYDPRPESERAGSVAESFNRITGLYLDSTQQGQMAMVLDTVGGLAALNNQQKLMRRQKIGITWMGTPNRWQQARGI